MALGRAAEIAETMQKCGKIGLTRGDGMVKLKH